ncbi:MAG: oxidoreductase [Phycisphaerae bacterium]|nr:oxidoreductase [Phycisphaerae bacterium]
MRIGIVDIDTSHPENWIPILRDMGHDVVGVFDGGGVHPDSYVREFAAKFDLKRYDDPVSLARDVNCGILHGCDWDKHVSMAKIFMQADKAVLVDKPMAGCWRDLQILAGWIHQGARITGGSLLYYCGEVRQFLSSDPREAGTLHTVLAGCAVDDFNYGVHAYALACGALGGGLTSVQFLGQNVQKQIRLEWFDGKAAILVIGQAGAWLPFHATLIAEKTVKSFVVDNTKIYHSFLKAVMPYLAGKSSSPPTDFNVLMEVEQAALAAKCSQEQQGRRVDIAELPSLNVRHDGVEFARSYRESKYPSP